MPGVNDLGGLNAANQMGRQTSSTLGALMVDSQGGVFGKAFGHGTSPLTTNIEDSFSRLNNVASVEAGFGSKALSGSHNFSAGIEGMQVSEQKIGKSMGAFGASLT